ncbi:hypothetical protein [Lactobacillus sp. ESL0234]|uniref:hypothetical protein n=2 Tax=Lactobacillus TaxID=1578 RepID=UPI001314F2EF|nr:hypothetical protein [Lactobacillus sp. ESL0234]
MIPGLIAGGMFKVILILITTFVNPNFVKTSSYMLLSAIGDAPFYFMPIVVAYGAAPKLGGTPTLFGLSVIILNYGISLWN